jgi:hypothetical protein
LDIGDGVGNQYNVIVEEEIAIMVLLVVEAGKGRASEAGIVCIPQWD